MPSPNLPPRIEYTIDSKSRRIRSTLTGAVSVNQLEEYVRSLEADPEYDSDFDVLIDLRHFTPTLSHEELLRVAQAIRQRSSTKGIRKAVLVLDEQTLNLTKAFEGMMVLSPVIYRAFSSESAAEAWLDERHFGRHELKRDEPPGHPHQ